MRRHRSEAGAERELEVLVTALGGGGDGIGFAAGERIYLPGAVPGERWRVRTTGRLAQGWRAEPLTCLEPRPRATPICPHFGRCGGCRLQHLPPALYVASKRQRIVDALARQHLPTDLVAEPIVAPPASRLRLRLGLARVGGRVRLGFRTRGSHRLEPVDACPIACPELSRCLPDLATGLNEALAIPLPEEASLTATRSGIDLVLHALRAPDGQERQRLPELATALDLARVSWLQPGGPPEPLAVRRQPVVELGGVTVALPPAAFVQATAFGAEQLAAAVTSWGVGCRRAVDLFAGIGTLTFPLSRQGCIVRAYEADQAAVAALRQATGRTGWGRITAEPRDLDRRPLVPAELARSDLVVLDPPRAGAAAQAAELAGSTVPRVVYASCHPESFARDARLLVGGGYELVEVRPIDQFLYAAEVELAALFQHPLPVRQKGLDPHRGHRYLRARQPLSPSSSGPGRRPLTAKTGVRVP